MTRHRYQAQPTPNSCGQTVLAMLLDVPVTRAIRDLGTAPTTAARLRCYLTLCKRVAGKPRRYRGTLPPLAIVRVIWNEKRHCTHWILYADGRFYDPAEPESRWNDDKFPRAGEVRTGGRILSFFEVSAR